MRRLVISVAVAQLFACAPSRRDVEIPDDIAWVGWVELSDTGRVTGTSRLFDLRSAEALLEVPSDDVVLVGVAADAFGSRLAPGTSVLEVAQPCRAVLPVTWTTDRPSTPVVVPDLTLPELDTTCRAEGADLPEASCRGVRCPAEPCLDLELEVRLLDVGPATSETSLHDAVWLGPEQLVVLEWSTRSVIAVTNGVVTASATLPGRGPLVSLGAAEGEVLVGDNDGTIHVLDHALATRGRDTPLTGRVKLVSRAGRVMAHDYGGVVVDRRGGTYQRRPDLPSAVLALDFDDTRVAWIDAQLSLGYLVDGNSSTLDRLSRDRDTPPVVALTPDGVVAGVHGILARYRPDADVQALPWGDGFDVGDELRALRYHGAVWAAGNGARWRRYDGWAMCDVVTGLARPFNALVTDESGAITTVASGAPFVVQARRTRP